MPLDRALLARLRIETLDRSKHDRGSFTCGATNIDNFLKTTVARQQDGDLTRCFVACLDDENAIIAFCAMNNHEIDVSSLPDERVQKLARFPRLGALYISMVGVHTEYQGKGLGPLMMSEAFGRCVQVANLTGAAAVVLDSRDERSTALYTRLGFVPVPTEEHPSRMIIAMKMVRAAMASAPPPA